MRGKTKLNTKQKQTAFAKINRSGLQILLAAILWSAGCATDAPNPLRGWTFRTYDTFAVPREQHHYQLDKAITEDLQHFLASNQLTLAEAVTGFFEDGTGRHALQFTVFVPNRNATVNYAIIYSNENRRVKVIRYGYQRYQS